MQEVVSFNFCNNVATNFKETACGWSINVIEHATLLSAATSLSNMLQATKLLHSGLEAGSQYNAVHSGLEAGSQYNAVHSGSGAGSQYNAVHSGSGAGS